MDALLDSTWFQLLGVLTLVAGVFAYRLLKETKLAAQREKEGRFSGMPYRVDLETTVDRERTRAMLKECLDARKIDLWYEGDLPLVGGRPTTWFSYGLTVRVEITEGPGVISLYVGSAGRPCRTKEALTLLAELERDWYSALAADQDAPSLGAYFRPATVI